MPLTFFPSLLVAQPPQGNILSNSSTTLGPTSGSAVERSLSVTGPPGCLNSATEPLRARCPEPALMAGSYTRFRSALPPANLTAGPLCRGEAPLATPPEMRYNQQPVLATAGPRERSAYSPRRGMGWGQRAPDIGSITLRTGRSSERRPAQCRDRLHQWAAVQQICRGL